MKQLIQVGALAAALVFTLIGSYLVYFDDSEGSSADPDGVPVYVATADQLQKVTWEGQDKTLVIERKDDGDTYLQVTVTTREERMPVAEVDQTPEDTDAMADTDAADTDASAPEPEPEPEPEIVETTTSFIGNKQADALWKDFAPFRADRELANTGDADLGLDEPFATLTVQRTTGPVEVIIGGTPYGDRARYVKSGDTVYLLKKRAISRIEATDKLMERSLHPLASADVEQMTVGVEGATRTLTHQNPDDRARSFWADAATPDTRDAAASAWAPDLIGLRASDYEPDLPGGVSTVFTASLQGDGSTHEIEVFTDGAESPTYYARTSHNRGVVRLTDSQAQTVVDDLDAMMNPTGTDE